jgi:hypothetical protein
VKKATRDLNQLLNNIESPMTRLETVHKKYTELLADMKKLDRDYAKSKKRADQLQKDQEKGKSELNKTVTMKDKLEKLCRELTKENKKVKVRRRQFRRRYNTNPHRMKIKSSKTLRTKLVLSSMNALIAFYTTFKTS